MKNVLIILFVVLFVNGCATINTENRENKRKYTLPTTEELTQYISIRNSQKTIEHGFGKSKNYSSNYRYLTQKYVDRLIRELKMKHTKLNINGAKIIEIELYKITSNQVDSEPDKFNGTMFVRLKLPEGKVINIVSKYNNLKSPENENINTSIHKMILEAVKNTMNTPEFIEYIK